MDRKNLIETIRDIESNQEKLRRRPYGMIEAIDGQFVRIQLRPWPKFGNLLETHWLQSMKSKRQQRNVCRLYYNQPIGHRDFLTLSYIQSSLNTTLKTLYATLNVLNQIAYIKRSNAILAEVANDKISDRSLVRRGWERHREDSRQRHWIKRFYGTYPAVATAFMNQTSLMKQVSSTESAVSV
jgi:hypothetical protein